MYVLQCSAGRRGRWNDTGLDRDGVEGYCRLVAYGGLAGLKYAGRGTPLQNEMEVVSVKCRGADSVL